MPFERLAWLNIFGVPPHSFSSKVFNLIGGRFGRLVHESQVKSDDGDFIFDCVGVLTDSGNLISGFLKLKWQDKSYRVWVNEEPSAWVPDCTGNIDELDDRSSAFSAGGRFPASPVVDGPVDKEDDEPLSSNVQSVDPPGVAEFAAHVVVGEGPLHVDKSSCFSPPLVSVPENRGNLSSIPPNSKDFFNDVWSNNVGQLTGRPRKRKRSKHGDSNNFEDLMGCSFGPKFTSGQQIRGVDSTVFCGKDSFLDKGDLNLNAIPDRASKI
ncbi:hypothetical protein HanIR_Chr02g0073181 [Helianthus annuus]|nr:hypothetical protein HanIR_Chr02g0073181 [Helianthus annuus]